MNSKEISTPVAIAIAVIVLVIIVGGGFWWMNRPTGAPAGNASGHYPGSPYPGGNPYPGGYPGGHAPAGYPGGTAAPAPQ